MPRWRRRRLRRARRSVEALRARDAERRLAGGTVYAFRDLFVSFKQAFSGARIARAYRAALFSAFLRGGAP